MSAAVDLRELDLDSGSDADLRAAHAIAAPALWHHVEGDEPLPFDEWLAEERKRRTIVDTLHVVADVAGDVVGHGFVELDPEGNTHLAWIQLAVAADHRRRGIARRLVGHLADLAAVDGRTSIGGGADEGSAGEPFLAGLGLTHRQTVHLNRLQVADLDRALLDGWVDRAAERAAGFRLLAWDGPTPDEHAEAFAACTEVMNTAPLGDLEIADEKMTVERLRLLEGARLASQSEWWTLVAVEGATGAFVGFTQLSFSGFRDWVAKQQDTGVDPAHRDRGLGRWLKAAMLLRLLDEKPAVTKIDTGNAGSNAPMLSINHALGFRPAKVSGNWQGELDAVRKHLSEQP